MSSIGRGLGRSASSTGTIPSGTTFTMGGFEDDRGREGLGLPSLRTVRAVLPHTALRLLVSSSGMSRVIPGRGKGEQPEIGEEGVRPALVIVGTAAEAWPLFLLAQDGPQPSSDEAVQMAMNGRRGLREVA